MPGRAIGVQWFSVNRKARTLAVDLELPKLLRPNSALRIPVKIGGLTPGEEARIVVAAVDVGILNLTGYKPPAPDDYYLGQRRLTADIRDLYGQLIDGMQGTRGQIRSGGDGAAAELQGSPPTQKPLALYSGIVTVKPDGTAEIVFDIPDFAGTARVMAVAWSKDKVGRAVGDVTIRDPVVLTATLAALSAQRRSRHHASRPRQRRGPGRRLSAGGEERGPQRRRQLPRRRRCGSSPSSAAPSRCRSTASGAGNATVVVRLSGPDGFALERSYALGVRPATQILARRTVKPLANGESLTLSSDLFADLVPGTGRVALSVGVSTALDAAALLAALDRYPFGCSEQITSRALPLLYVNDLAIGGASCVRHGDRPAHPRLDRPAARAAGLERLVRPVVGGRRRRVARFLRHRLPDAGARARLRRARRRVQAGARSAAQLRRQRAGPVQGRRAQSRLCALCAGAQRRRSGRRSALFRRHQARRDRNPDRQGADRGGARHARRPRARRARLCGGARRSRAASRCSTTAASTTARRCATRRRW